MAGSGTGPVPPSGRWQLITYKLYSSSRLFYYLVSVHLHPLLFSFSNRSISTHQFILNHFSSHLLDAKCC